MPPPGRAPETGPCLADPDVPWTGTPGPAHLDWHAWAGTPALARAVRGWAGLRRWARPTRSAGLTGCRGFWGCGGGPGRWGRARRWESGWTSGSGRHRAGAAGGLTGSGR